MLGCERQQLQVYCIGSEVITMFRSSAVCTGCWSSMVKEQKRY